MKKETMYLDYINNFLTVERFAEYYDISEDEANDIIELGRLRFEKYFNVKINDMKLQPLNKAFTVTVKEIKTCYEQGRKVYIRVNKTKKTLSLGYNGLFYPCIDLLIKNKLIVLDDTIFTIDEKNKITGKYQDFVFIAGEYYNEIEL